MREPLAGKLTKVSLLPTNALPPIRLTELGIDIFVNEFDENANGRILCRPLGRLTLVRPLEENADGPIRSTG